MLKSPNRDTSTLCAAYREYLLGKPLEKLQLTPGQLDHLQLYIKSASQGLSGCQVSDTTGGILSGALCCELRSVQKSVRRARKDVKNGYSKNRKTALKKFPELVKETIVKPKPLTLPAVYKLRRDGVTQREIFQRGGNSGHLQKCIKVDRMILKGIDSREIAETLVISQSDLKIILQLNKENKKGIVVQ